MSHVRTVLGGLVIVVGLVLAGCQEAPAPGNGAPDPVELIVGRWRATEYMVWQEADDGSLEQFDLLSDGRRLTVIFDEDGSFTWAFDPISHGVDSGSYELLDGSRILLITSQPITALIGDYSIDASRLRLELETAYPNRVDVLSATRM